MLWKERVNGTGRSRWDDRRQRRSANKLALRHQSGSCGCVSFYRRIGESFESPEKTLPPADSVPRPGWQSHRDAKRVQGGSRDIQIVQPKVPSWPRRHANEVRSKERVNARRRL